MAFPGRHGERVAVRVRPGSWCPAVRTPAVTHFNVQTSAPTLTPPGGQEEPREAVFLEQPRPPGGQRQHGDEGTRNTAVEKRPGRAAGRAGDGRDVTEGNAKPQSPPEAAGRPQGRTR